MLSGIQHYRLSRTASDSLVLWLSKTPTGNSLLPVPTNTHAHKTQTCADVHGCTHARARTHKHTASGKSEKQQPVGT